MAAILDVPVRHAVLIRTTPEHVYDALTTAEGLDAWFTVGAEVDPRPGGVIRFRWHNWGPDCLSAEDEGTVREARRPERFVFEWHPDQPDYATLVTFELTPTDHGTILRVEERGFHDTPRGFEAALNCAAGGGEALTLVKFYLEHGLRY